MGDSVGAYTPHIGGLYAPAVGGVSPLFSRLCGGALLVCSPEALPAAPPALSLSVDSVAEFDCVGWFDAATPLVGHLLNDARVVVGHVALFCHRMARPNADLPPLFYLLGLDVALHLPLSLDFL